MKNILKPSLILGFMAFVAAFILSHMNNITYPEIAKQAAVKQKNALALVLPSYKVGPKRKVLIDGTLFIYWVGEKVEEDNTLKGYAFETSAPGYSGEVKSMVGVDETGLSLAISILKQTETPGLGARSEEIASKSTFFGKLFGKGVEEGNVRPWFQIQYSGLKLNEKINIVKIGDWNESMKDDLLSKNSVTSITGATITTRTVAASLENGFKRLLKAIEMDAKSKEEVSK